MLTRPSLNLKPNQVLTNALTYASKDYRRLHNWADEYNGNINMKYDQVSKLLVNIESGQGILTSPNGLGGSAQTRELMVDNIAVWGKCSTGNRPSANPKPTRGKPN